MIFKFHISILLFSLMVLNNSNVYGQKGNLKVLSYNVLKGFQGSEENKMRFNIWVNKKAPDIVFFQEMNGFTQKSLEDFAMGYGHGYAVIAKESGYSVAITSRFPIVNVQKVLDNMWHGYIYANIKDIHVFAVHLSPFLYQKRISESKQILAQAELLPKGSMVMIAGDFNALQVGDSANYTAKSLKKLLVKEAKNLEIRNLNKGNFDYSVTEEFTKKGYEDALNLFSKSFNFTMPTTKYDASYKQKIRIDYVWLNKALKRKVETAAVIYDEDTAEMSDHYPIFLNLKY